MAGAHPAAPPAIVRHRFHKAGVARTLGSLIEVTTSFRNFEPEKVLIEASIHRCYIAHLRRFGLRAASQAPDDQNCVACLVSAALACAVACTRARPITAFTPLSHMLINGLFFIHGLATDVSGLGLL